MREIERPNKDAYETFEWVQYADEMEAKLSRYGAAIDAVVEDAHRALIESKWPASMVALKKLREVEDE